MERKKGQQEMKMKNKWTANWGLKILSLLFAVVLWFLVTNINDPTVPVRFTNVPVKIVNSGLLSDEGKVYSVIDNTDVITQVVVRAPRSVTQLLSKENIVATADMDELSSLDTIAIHLTTNVRENQVESITGSHDIIKLNIEMKKSKSIPLTATTSGTVEEGYMIGDTILDQNLVNIEGPETLINQVAKAVVDVNVTNFTSDIGTDAKILLYNDDNKLIQSDLIKQNISVVRVKVQILQTKLVGIDYNVTGSPAPGFRATGDMLINPSSVLVAGKSSVLSDYSSIELPEGTVDITGQSEDYQKVVNVSSYLPDSIRLADPEFNGNVTVTVSIKQEASKNLLVRERNIAIRNQVEGYTVEFENLDENSYLYLVGLAEDVNGVNSTNLSGTIDILELMNQYNLNELREGYYTMEVTFDLSENIIIVEPFEVMLHITTKED